MASPVADSYSCASGGAIYAGMSSPIAPWAPSAGTIANVSLNTRDDIDPTDDAAANPDHPSAGPWEDGGFAWHTVTSYCGALIADAIGAHGTYLQYGGAGHSCCNPCFMFGFDLDDRLWKRIQQRPLPTDSLGLAAGDEFNLGTYYSASDIDATWGNWKGDSASWGALAQAGYNPPFGGHTRNSFVYRPPSAAGNTDGQVLIAWQLQGRLAGTGITGSHVWNADTGLWSHTANARPGSASDCGGIRYFPALDAVIGFNQQSDAVGYTALDVLDCSTMTWARRTMSNSIDITIDSTCFACDDLFVWVKNTTNATRMEFYATEASKVKAGTAVGWTPLTVSAASWPDSGNTGAAGYTRTVQWEQCPLDGNFYAVNRMHGSNKLWKLAPPAGDTAAKLAGTWTITEQTLAGVTLDGRLSGGETTGPSFDYSRLRWSSWANAFIWTPDYVLGNVQAIRPQGV